MLKIIINEDVGSPWNLEKITQLFSVIFKSLGWLMPTSLSQEIPTSIANLTQNHVVARERHLPL